MSNTPPNIDTSFKQTVPPNELNVLEELKRDIGVNLNCIQIGIIQAFDPGDQTATIQLALKQVTAVKPDGTKILAEHPVLLKCPVMFLQGGAAYITMPITPGDNCIVLFNDREIDNWFAAGGVQTPLTGRTHDISDGIAIVGIKNLQTAIAGYLTNGIRTFFNANTKMDITDRLFDIITDLLHLHGNQTIEGNLTIKGTTYGNSSDDWNIDANIRQVAGRSIHAGNGFSGTIGGVTFVDGIAIA